MNALFASARTVAEVTSAAASGNAAAGEARVARAVRVARVAAWKGGIPVEGFPWKG